MSTGLGAITEDMEDQLSELVDTFEDLFDEQVEGLWPGTQETRGDAQFAYWFLFMLKSYGPDWAVALEFVEDGKDVLKRWNKVSAAMMGGSNGRVE